MATIPIVHTSLNPVQLILNMVTGIPADAQGKPHGTIGTAGGTLQGQIIGLSLTPTPGSLNGTESSYDKAFLYMNVDAGGQAFVPLESVTYIKFNT